MRHHTDPLSGCWQCQCGWQAAQHPFLLVLSFKPGAAMHGQCSKIEHRQQSESNMSVALLNRLLLPDYAAAPYQLMRTVQHQGWAPPCVV
jgi:hypothetical protein